jgi:hypothetical protein
LKSVRALGGVALLLCLGPAVGSAATIVVNDAGDALHAPGCATTGTGTCTLRDAITFANANPGLDTISFAIGSGLATILPSTALPNVTDPVVIDGTTQPGFAGMPLIELDGRSLSGAIDGLSIPAGCTVRGLAVNDFPGNGISVQGTGSLIAGNFIGTDVFGASARPNSGQGISVAGPSNTIGGLAPTDRNVISGNLGDGIRFNLPGGENNLVQGNYIGTDRTGLVAIGNLNGILVNEASGNIIGGSTASPGTPPGNLISGNHSAGIQTLVFSGGDRAQTVIIGNLIGTNAAGTSALGNQGDGVLVSGGRSNVIGGPSSGDRNVISGNSNGIHITNFGLAASSDTVVEGNSIGTDILGTSSVGNISSGVLLDTTFHNVIGGTQPGQGNLISGNGGSGVTLALGGATGSQNRIVGNRIGTDASGSLPLANGGAGVRVSSNDNAVGEPGAGNIIAFNTGPGVVFTGLGDAIRGNAIFSNAGLGIDAGSGVAPNDSCDLDFLQNFPVLTSATGGGFRTRVLGSLNSHPFETFVVDFYANSGCDPSGYGEGQRFLGSTLVATDGNCDSSFDVSLPGQTDRGEVVTATATDQFNATSEFSACVPVQGLAFNTVAPCRVADTRTPESAPALVANSDRAFLVGGHCGIPLTAQAVAFNFTVTQPTSSGHVTVYPGGTALVATSTINYSAGQTRANNAVIPLGLSGDILVRAAQGAGTVHFVIDVFGYFE